MVLLISTSYTDLSEEEKKLIKEGIQKIASDSFCIDSDKVVVDSFLTAKESQNEKTVSIMICSDEIYTNSGRQLIQFKNKIIEYISRWYKNFSEEKLVVKVCSSLRAFSDGVEMNRSSSYEIKDVEIDFDRLKKDLTSKTMISLDELSKI